MNQLLVTTDDGVTFSFVYDEVPTDDGVDLSPGARIKVEYQSDLSEDPPDIEALAIHTAE